MMTFYLVTLLVVILLALGLLGLVGLVAAANHGGDQTRLGERLRTLQSHLNGEAEPPAAITAIFAPLTNTLEARRTRKLEKVAAEEAPAAEPIKVRRPAATREVTVETEPAAEQVDSPITETASHPDAQAA